MKTKPGVKISLGDAEARGVKFANKAGFDAGVRKLGPDSQPGPNPGSPGAPLYNSKTVDDYTAKKTTFWAGSGPTPGGLNGTGRGPTMELDVNRNVKQPDNPVPVAQMPHKGDTSKAQEVAREDPSMGLGVAPTGTLSR